MPNRRRLWVLLALLGLTVLGSTAALVLIFRDEILPEHSPSHRGELAARRAGCLACHGGAGEGGRPNPFTDGQVVSHHSIPSLFKERHSPSVLRQWIENGISDSKAASQAHLQSRDREAVQMPAFKERLSPSEIDDLAAYLALQELRHQTSQNPEDPAISEGERLARRFSCFTCHGELGQGGVENPRSLKGYVPGFYGGDFLALTDGGRRDEVQEWIRRGISQSFLDRGVAGFSPGRYFTERQAIRMPEYESYLTAEQIDLLTDYVLELQALGAMDAEAILRYRPLEDAAEAAEPPSAAATAPSFSEGEYALFQQAKPLLQRCLNCHGPSDQKSEYRIDTRGEAIRGGEIADFTGTPSVVPGNSDASRMIAFVEALEEDPMNEIYPMPPKGERLTPTQIQVLRRWIDGGFRWPPGADLLPPPEK